MCALSDEELVDRYTDLIGTMVRNISGRKLNNSYEMDCEIGRVRSTKSTVYFDALCENEGEKSRKKGVYKIVSATSFRIGSDLFSLCPPRRITGVVKSAADVSSELKWQEKNISQSIKGHLTRFYNREFVAMHDRNIDWDDPPFVVAEFPLRKDSKGSSAIIVRWKGHGMCGSGGCAMHVWMEKDGNYERFLDVTGDDIRLGDVSQHGVLDLWIDDNRFRWVGQKYERR
jgi:hypothetical protein